MHPSGNEDIPRSHWLRTVVLVGLILLGLTVQAWLNLASIAARAYPGWGGSGVLGTAVTAIFRWGTVRRVGDIVPTAFLRGYLGGMLHGPFQHGLTPDQAFWLGQWRYAVDHIMGSPPLYMGMAWNLVFVVCVVLLGSVLAANRLVSTRSIDARLGTSEWAPPKALRPYLRAAGSLAVPLGRPRPAPGALPLGRITKDRPGAGREIALPLRDLDHHIGRFSHVSLWGVPEAGKTSGIFKPWLWRDSRLNDATITDREGWAVGAMSSVAIDMKHPDLFTSLAPYLAPRPRRLLVLAPGHPETSLHYNPLDFITLDTQPEGMSDIAVVADAIVMNTPLGHRDDAFYRAVETKLLELVIQFVVEARQSQRYREIQQQVRAMTQPLLPPGMPAPPLCSFPMIAVLVSLHSTALLELIQQIGALIHPDRPDWWAVRVAQFLQMNKQPAGMAGLLLGLGRRIALFTRPEVASVSTRSDFSLDLLGRQPGTFLIGMPRLSTEATQTYSALIITQLLQQLKRLAARSPDHRLPVPVTIDLDELANQGRIPRLEDEIATLRDLGVAFVLGLQNTDALRARYGKEAATSMMSNTNTKIVLGRNLGTDDAELFALMAGDTTLLTARTSEGPYGATLGVGTARRAFMTPDQIRRMKQFEALVFLQSGHLVNTRLTPFHEMDRVLRDTQTDPVIATGSETVHGFVHPVFLLRHRHEQLDRTLGPWDTRSTPTPAPVPPVPAIVDGPDPDTKRTAVAALLEQARQRDPAQAPPDGQDGHHDGHDEGARAGEPQETASAPVGAGSDHGTTPPPADGARHIPRTEQPPAAEPAAPASRDDALAHGTQAPAPASSGDGQGTEGAPARPPTPALEPAALQDLTGFFRAITLRGTVTSPEIQRGAPAGWRAALGGGSHLLVRWALLVGYADRRGLRATEMLARWQRADLVRDGRRSVTGSGEPISVVAFTPRALSRLIPAIADRVSVWPVLAPEQVRDGSTPVPVRTTAPEPLRATTQRQVARLPRSVPRNDPEGALRAVIRWAHAHRAELSGADRQLGQWDGVTRDTPVLLIRSQQVMQILGRQGYDAQGVLVAWRDSGVIVTVPGRFTVRMRSGESDEEDKDFRGAYFMAFAWNAIQRAGLQH